MQTCYRSVIFAHRPMPRPCTSAKAANSAMPIAIRGQERGMPACCRPGRAGLATINSPRGATPRVCNPSMALCQRFGSVAAEPDRGEQGDASTHREATEPVDPGFRGTGPPGWRSARRRRQPSADRHAGPAAWGRPTAATLGSLGHRTSCECQSLGLAGVLKAGLGRRPPNGGARRMQSVRRHSSSVVQAVPR